MRKYVQTYCKRSTDPAKAVELAPPDGEGWQLHSWQLDTSTNSQFIVVIWSREVPG